MKTGTFIAEIESALSGVKIVNIPTVLFISLKSVSSRLKPVFDHDISELDDQTMNELKALMDTVENFKKEEDTESTCAEIDGMYVYELKTN